jgi:hypothetical protein
MSNSHQGLLRYSLNAGEGPEADNSLPGYRASRFYHKQQNRRPPDAIHKLSLRNLWPALSSALHAAEYITNQRPFLTSNDRLWVEPCLAPVEHFLYTVAEYIEECELILQCCFPDKVAFESSEHVKRYRKVIKLYRDRVGRIVNAIKHRQGRLNLFAFFDAEFVAPG